jgi:hypothetical protein
MRGPGRGAPAVQAADTTVQMSETAKQAKESTLMTPAQTRVRSEAFLASVIVPRASSTRDITALASAMQGLALDTRHPVALELAATASSRHFLLRAASALSLRHLADQVQARYPPGHHATNGRASRSSCVARGRDDLCNRITRGGSSVPPSACMGRTRVVARGS